MKTRIKVIINGKICTGRAGQTLLEIAQNNGIEIPNLCHNGELKHYGGCSLCVVEAEGSPKLLRACSTVAQDGQVIYTESERVVRTRKTSIELLMSDHDGDCRGPCVLNCPASVNAQGYVQAIARGDDKEAVRIIKERLPMPACIGRVCPHPCEDGCRRQMVEESISIAYLKYFAADRVIQAGGYLPPKAAATGKRVGIIGGGPGGLTAAYYLSLKGHRVTVVDAMPQMGGMLRYGIPEYRLPKRVLDEEVAEIASLGVEMKNNFRIGRDVTFEEFIDKVADETTISSADVKAVFDRAGKVLVEQLREGKSVDCGDLGTFRPSLTTKTGTGAETAEGVTMEMIDKLKVIYTPRVRIKDALKKVRMERAERLLDVAFGSKKKPIPGGTTPTPNPGGTTPTPGGTTPTPNPGEGNE